MKFQLSESTEHAWESINIPLNLKNVYDFQLSCERGVWVCVQGAYFLKSTWKSSGEITGIIIVFGTTEQFLHSFWVLVFVCKFNPI